MISHLHRRVWFIIALTIVALLSIVPWTSLGISLPSFIPHSEYKLWLDLNGGVELDYKIDTEEALKRNPETNIDEVAEGLKKIIEKRVNSLGTAEPTISRAQYGWEEHIIVQIPTIAADLSLSEAEQRKRNDEYIAQAKSTIGKVVTLEFKEAKTTITDADKKEREQLAIDARARIASGETIESIAEKLTLNHENVRFESGSGTKEELPSIVSYPGIKESTGKYLSEVVKTKAEKALTLSGETAKEGYSVIEWDISLSGSTKLYAYKALWIDQTPSAWQVAKTQDGKSLNDQYLSDAQMVFSQNAQPQIQLTFNEEGKKIFGEISERLIGEQLAIFVGGDLITAPVIQTKIADGLAVISGNYTIDEAKEQAQDIKTGIVPAPIYLSSERTIDAKIGRDALQTILIAGVIGLGVIIVFLTYVYRVAGLLAGVALIIYAILLIALVKSFSIVLTLASIAGVILSIGLAIDANILIFERMKESLRDGKNLVEATLIGFEKSWSAIWDSHVTSLTSAFILFIFGVNLIKGFGLMLGLGIILSLFTAMWVSRILLLSVTSRFQHSKESFIGKLGKNPEKS